MKKHDGLVVILGAGLAGLTAGFQASKVGKKVLILEKNPYVGGLATTFKVGQYRFDTGPHRWYTKIKEADDLVRQVMGKEMILVNRLTRIYFAGKYYYYPMQPLNALSGIGILKAIRALIDYFLIKALAKVRPYEIVTMEDAYVNQFGRTLYETFFKNYTEKLWGKPCTKLSGDWVAQRSRGMSIWTVVRNAFFPQKGKVVSLVEQFHYPKLGVGRIAERLSEEIKKKGGEVYLNCPVIKIKTEKTLVKKIIVKKNSGTEVISGDEFISSIPITSLIKSLDPPPDPEVLKANLCLSFRSEVFVVLFLKKGAITKDQWIYTQDSKLPFVRFEETDNWSPFLSPAGTTSLVFEVACDENDKVWQMDDQKITDWIINKYVSEFKTIKKEDIASTFVHRQENEYPVYPVGYEKSIKKVKDYLKKFSNLQLVGRSGMYRYNNMDHTIQSGIWAAKNLVGGNFNLEEINIEKEYHEEKKAV
jgi:protoporphyrinogen oxidase